jgi:ABC-type nitrate/sulfonate/bicarbonate transport system substrate-binding protein
LHTPPKQQSRGFIEIALRKGGLTMSDVDSVGAPGDPANVAMMQAKRADFQVGGVPSRMTLQIAGFKPILTSGDLASYATASADSVELRAVFHDGWIATDSWINANYETALRIASSASESTSLYRNIPMRRRLSIHHS